MPNNLNIRVSVCVPTYNQSNYLECAIRSAFSQTLIPIEIIVSDDCSTDSTVEILDSLSRDIPILKVIHQESNLGIAKNTDACLRLASGDFIVRLDSDDCLAPDYIKRLSTALENYPLAGYAHAAVQEIDNKGSFLRERRLFRTAGYQAGDEALKAASKGYRVAANIIMFRKEVLEKLNYVSERPNYVEDYHLASSIAAALFGNVYLNEVLSYYRVWLDSGNIRQRRKLDEITGIRKVFEEVLEPAYRCRNWQAKILAKRRTDFACNHSNCLAWKTYNVDEKKQLAVELRNLSGDFRTILYTWLYLNGYGGPFIFMKEFKLQFRLFFKKFFYIFIPKS